MDFKLRGRYKPEEILRIEEGKEACKFSKDVIHPEIKAIILPEKCTKLEEGIILDKENGFDDIFPNLREIVWPNIEEMRPFQFAFCKNLKYFQTKSCRSFPEGAFKESGLISIILPSNLIELGIRCFSECKSLHDVDMSNLTSTIDLPDFCFIDCIKLSEFDFSKCKAIGRNTFNNTGIRKAVLNSSSDDACIVKSCAFAKSLLEYLEINGNVYLEKLCFSSCYKLKNVKLNSPITSFPEKAFYGDSSLYTISGINNIESVGNYCFADCSLKTINEFTGLKTIGYSAFIGNRFEEIVTNASEISDYAFSLCLNLKKITLTSPELKHIPSMIFNLSSLDFLDLSKTGITDIPASLFQGVNLQEIILPNTLTTIGSQAFARTSINKIVIPFSVTKIESYAFYKCKNLEEVIWSNNCKEVKEGTFAHCCNLKNFIGSESIELIENWAFDEIKANLKLPQVKKISDNAFGFSYGGIVDLRESCVLIDSDSNALPKDVLLPYFYYE